MTWLYRAVRPALFALPPETAHRITHQLGASIQHTPVASLLHRRYGDIDPRLQIDRFGSKFESPLGVAAGFDKNARIPGLLGRLGFGHVEIGGVTSKPQSGNPRPRMFRLTEDEAIINRMGFNNDGADRIAARLDERPQPSVPLGINIGKAKAVPPRDAPEDYVYTYERLAIHGDFFVINVSSPNTPGLREFQERDRLAGIVDALQDAGAGPLLVKLSPDLHASALREICALVNERKLDGIVATNTTIERESLASPHAAEPGGLSGAPLTNRATEVIETVYRETDVPIVGVGGIFTAEDAYEKIRAGASLLQLYTALIYRGPGIAQEINNGLIRLLDRDGYDQLEDAIGTASE